MELDGLKKKGEDNIEKEKEARILNDKASGELLLLFSVPNILAAAEWLYARPLGRYKLSLLRYELSLLFSVPNTLAAAEWLCTRPLGRYKLSFYKH